MTFQNLILKLSEFWASRGCALQQPLDVEVGAGTMHPETFLRVLGPAHWNVAYVQPSRRPADARFGENPNRLFKHHQFQGLLKPAPDEVQQMYLESLEACGINPRQHDIRFEEDNWESPTLGAWGIGWQVMFDGLEITQFTYFQQAGGIELSPISAELTYGLERIAMVLQRVDSVYDLEWAPGVKYGEVRLRDEIEQSKYVFGHVQMPAGEAFGAFHRDLFDRYYRLAASLLAAGPIWAAPKPSAGKPRRMDRELLLEIGCEELPASWLPALTNQIGKTIEDQLREHRMPAEAPAETFSTPRRLTVRIARVPERQTDLEELVNGPPVSAAFGKDGAPTPAAAGFASKHGVDVAALERVETPKGAYLAFRKKQRGKAAADVLPDVLGGTLRALVFPKLMRWDAAHEDGRGELLFGRPIRWVLCVYVGRVAPFTIARSSAA